MASEHSGTRLEPVSIDTLPWEEWSEGTRFGGRVRQLSPKGAHVGVFIEEALPGMQTCALHYHMIEEEHQMLLEGRATLLLGDGRRDLKPGDFISFPAGQAAGHALVNTSDAPCRHLMLGNNSRNEVVVYPETDTVLVRSLGEIYDKSAVKETRPLRASQRSEAILEPVAVEGLAWKERFRGSRFGGRIRRLSPPDAQIGVLIVELPPGRQYCPVHYHLLEEEHLMMLEGQGTLRLGSGTHRMKAGDFVTFPAGQQAGHALVNESDAPCRYMMIGENHPDEVIVYPETGKVLVHRMDEIYDRASLRDYWDGEQMD